MLAVWVNGERGAPLDHADRGLYYGDGLFETIAVTARGPRLLDRHMSRLRCGAAVLGISLPDEALLRHEIAVAAATPGAAVVKLIVTRGVGGRGFGFGVDGWWGAQACLTQAGSPLISQPSSSFPCAPQPPRSARAPTVGVQLHAR